MSEFSFENIAPGFRGGICATRDQKLAPPRSSAPMRRCLSNSGRGARSSGEFPADPRPGARSAPRLAELARIVLIQFSCDLLECGPACPQIGPHPVYLHRSGNAWAQRMTPLPFGSSSQANARPARAHKFAPTPSTRCRARNENVVVAGAVSQSPLPTHSLHLWSNNLNTNISFLLMRLGRETKSRRIPPSLLRIGEGPSTEAPKSHPQIRP